MSDVTNSIHDLKAWFRGDARNSGSYRMGALLVDELERVEAERDRLREHNNTLKLALSEALEEIEATTDTSAMGAGRLAQHRLWMAGMRAALQEAWR